MMPSVGPMELLIVLVIAVIIIGPKKIPELGKSVGGGLREFKASISGDERDKDEDDSHTSDEAHQARVAALTPPR